MTSDTTARGAPVAPGVTLPPQLEPGDHLTREEFERRYDATPRLKKAELIEGVVYMPPPLRWRHHATPHAEVVGWLIAYKAATPGVHVGDNASIRLDLDNEPQPDAAMLIDPARGGQAAFTPDDYVCGAPELVAEVTASSASIDLNTKLRVYRRNNVREYLVWRVLDAAIDWFVLRQGRYEPMQADAGGVLRSEAFPGLWLDVTAILRGDSAGVSQVLQHGLASPEHAAFVARLQP